MKRGPALCVCVCGGRGGSGQNEQGQGQQNDVPESEACRTEGTGSLLSRSFLGCVNFPAGVGSLIEGRPQLPLGGASVDRLSKVRDAGAGQAFKK